MKETSNHKPILGYSDEDTVKLDVDQMSFSRVKYWASKALRHFKLQGFIILKSSKDCYHVIFDRAVSWAENMSMVAWVALLSDNEGLKRYHLMQCIKKCSTLRVSSKKEKPSPRVIFLFGKQDKQVKDFLKTRKIVKKIEKKLRITRGS